ncbi:MAG: DUF433 domain-containing protein [Symploca sp. SIO1B1]|nr:DUF433 domain-containing protein [Symploca sp. SIO2D2]NER23843.1 DUF433 domain-containing protein [Symploca sp. SIO1C2]NER47408.1 DUF433 domain-containing protein [Symploca sp. SIO1A3]NER99247.1 DUF433 domain-containing protein [Symploca sp. SIO1B1]
MVKTNGNIQPTVIRTQRGLSVSGTRITLYQIMACLQANLSPELIRDRFKLSIQQMNDVLKYINQNRDEVETEYQKILEQAETNRQYWENRHREQLLNAEQYIATTPPQQAEEKIWTKLHTWKNRIAQEYSSY